MSRLTCTIVYGLLSCAACGDDAMAPVGAATDAEQNGAMGEGAAGAETVEVANLREVLDFEPMIEGEWTLEPGTEVYFCVRQTIEEDVWVTAFAAIDPPGTHHGVLTMGYPSGQDGVRVCSDPGETQGGGMLYGYGLGTDPFQLPEGVAIKLEAGMQLMLNVHTYNVGDEEITGLSGVEYVTIPESEVETLAEFVLMGPMNLNLPAGEETVQEGGCTMGQPATLLAVAPHMHQLGIHMKVTTRSTPMGVMVILDEVYDFDNQDFRTFDPIKMDRGDRVDVECTYMNDTDATVEFGSSSDEEMCYATLLRYPVFSDSVVCSD